MKRKAEDHKNGKVWMPRTCKCELMMMMKTIHAKTALALPYQIFSPYNRTIIAANVNNLLPLPDGTTVEFTSSTQLSSIASRTEWTMATAETAVTLLAEHCAAWRVKQLVPFESILKHITQHSIENFSSIYLLLLLKTFTTIRNI